MEDEERWPLCEALLADIAPHLENGKIKKLPDDDEIELRARIGGTPLKINFEVDMGWVRPEMKITNRTGDLDLERDHEKIPQDRDPDDDWADEDELRVFVAKGIFVEGDEPDVNGTLGTLAALPSELSQRLLAEMERLRMSRLYAFSDSLSVGFQPNNYEMADPVQHILDGLRLMKELADALAKGDRDMASEPNVIIRGHVEIDGQRVESTQGIPQAAAIGRVKCAYCSTLFVSAAEPRCPNCGAPLTG